MLGMLVFLVAVSLFAHKPADTSMSYTQFLAAVDQNKVKDAAIREGDQVVTGTLVQGGTYELKFPADSEGDLVKALVAKNVPIDTNPQKPNPLINLLEILLPVVLLGALLVYLMNRSQVGDGRVMQLGRSRHMMLTRDMTT